MSTRASIGSLLSGLAGGGLGDTIKKLCEAASSGDAVKIGAVLTGLSGGPLLAVGVLLGGLWLQISGERKDAEKQDELFDELRRQWEAVGGDLHALIAQLTPFIERKDHFLARLPGYEKAELGKLVAEAVREELAPLLPGGADHIDWQDVAIFLNQNNKLLDDLHGWVQDIRQDVGDIKEMLVTGRARLPTIRPAYITTSPRPASAPTPTSSGGPT